MGGSMLSCVVMPQVCRLLCFRTPSADIAESPRHPDGGSAVSDPVTWFVPNSFSAAALCLAGATLRKPGDR
jgi:hypothetical protein